MRAIFNFDARNNTELTLKSGDVIANCEFVNDTWVRGELVGKRGLFPISYVENIPEDLSSVTGWFFEMILLID